MVVWFLNGRLKKAVWKLLLVVSLVCLADIHVSHRSLALLFSLLFFFSYQILIKVSLPWMDKGNSFSHSYYGKSKLRSYSSTMYLLIQIFIFFLFLHDPLEVDGNGFKDDRKIEHIQYPITIYVTSLYLFIPYHQLTPLTSSKIFHTHLFLCYQYISFPRI